MCIICAHKCDWICEKGLIHSSNFATLMRHIFSCISLKPHFKDNYSIYSVIYLISGQSIAVGYSPSLLLLLTPGYNYNL